MHTHTKEFIWIYFI